ncbi:MAG: hypothetical protein M1414_02805 [Candidatus Thermoplasmatota archaeon]|jgi:hypothetical protein|nr:hypothetical protein [Candidatus Thermoplasmatota archaeon]MCL5987817.1 hypothetical protein [Candidatus Thermoplasmatota archaeon]
MRKNPIAINITVNWILMEKTIMRGEEIVIPPRKINGIPNRLASSVKLNTYICGIFSVKTILARLEIKKMATINKIYPKWYFHLAFPVRIYLITRKREINCINNGMKYSKSITIKIRSNATNAADGYLLRRLSIPEIIESRIGSAVTSATMM